jgi:hypothetical protein
MALKLPPKNPAPAAPAAPDPAHRPTDLEAFIASADEGRQAKPLPWINARTDLRVTLNTRIPERLSAKVEWLAAELHLSKQDVTEEALTAWCAWHLAKRSLPE